MFRTPSSKRSFAAGLAIAIPLLLAATEVRAVEEDAPTAPSDSLSSLDPVVRDVVRLLDEHLGEALIVRWLAESGGRPARLSASDLVALKRAGASDELVGVLLDRAREAAKAPAESAAPPTSPSGVAAPSAPVAAEAAPADGVSVVPVGAEMRYIHYPYEDELAAKPWQLVVYLDGRPWPPMEASITERNARTFTAESSLAPGPHVVRWAQERPREEGRRKRVLHQSRFGPGALRFELAPGAPASIQLEFRDRSGVLARAGGPIDARATQGERELAVVRSDEDPTYWKLLCEDVEANLGGRKPDLDARAELKQCVRWAELWNGAPPVPSRGEVRPALQ